MLDVVQLTQDLVAIKSVSQQSNSQISDLLAETFRGCDFDVERLEYDDEQGERKVNLVAKKGSGTGGLGLFSHSDTVPGIEWAWDPYSPVIKEGRVMGRGSCDMKGPLAATIVAADSIDVRELKQPVYVVVTADEEVNGVGAKHVARESAMFQQSGPEHGVIAEPTSLVPVYAHKGGAAVIVTAHGKAAHTSTDRGVSANFLIAPFLAEMAEMAERLGSDESFMNHEFVPPTNGFNMVLNDGGCKTNVTAAKTVCTVGFRTMPNDRRDDVIAEVTERARKHNLEVDSRVSDPFYISTDAKIVQTALQATGLEQPQTVPFGTDAHAFKHLLELVILGPGDIAQAHTVGEWIEVEQLHRAVDVYRRMIQSLCC